ncbi:MAG: hypothetical protein ACI8TX_003480, partial [Hyphomicrobiaceae bacterium]
ASRASFEFDTASPPRSPDHRPQNLILQRFET